MISGTLQLIKRKDSPILVDVYNSSYLKKIPSPSLVESTDQIVGVRPQEIVLYAILEIYTLMVWRVHMPW